MSGVIKSGFLCFAMFLGVMLQAAVPCRIYLDPAAECGIFTARKGHKSFSERSVIRLSYDRESLVLEGTLYAPEGKKFSCKGKKDDDLTLFNGSVFEFQLAPAAQKGVYYHFGLSPSSRMYSARKQDLKWNGKGIVYTSGCIPEKEWRFTLKIPFRAIGEKTPEKGDVWRFHMGKSVVTAFAPVEHSSISGATNYHKVEQYGYLVFGKKAPQEQSLILSHIVPRGKEFTFYFRGGKNGEADSTLHFNVPGNSHGGVLPLKKSSFSGWSEVTFSPLAAGSVLPLKGNLKLHVRVLNRKKELLYRDTMLLPVKDLSKVSLDRFYYTKQNGVIRYSHTLPGKCTLLVKKGSGTVYRKENVANRGELPLSALKLTPGRYVLEITDTGHSVQKLFFLLAKEPALPPMKKGEILKIRKDLTFSLGNECLYLLGLSRAKVAVPYKSVFNFAYNPAGSRGNAVVMPGMPGGKLVRKPFTGRIYGDESKYLKTLADHVCKLQDGNRGIFHLLSYEASIPAVVRDSRGNIVPGSPADLMRRAYRTAKSLAPDSLFSIHVDRAEQIPFYAPHCDIFQCAYWNSSYGQDMIPDMEKDLNLLRKTVPDKPLIFWLGGTIPHHQYRIAEELRCSVYLSILKGMAGNIIHMGHEPMPVSRTRMWSFLGGLPVEIEGFYKDFISGKHEEFSLEKGSPFTAAMRLLPDGRKILVVVNTGASPAELILPGNLAKEIRIYGDGEEILRAEKKKTASFLSFLLPERSCFKDTFCGYEPKVYYLRD